MFYCIIIFEVPASLLAKGKILEPHIGAEWPIDPSGDVTVHLFGEGAKALIADGSEREYFLRHGNVVIEGTGAFSTKAVSLTRRLSSCIPSSNQTRLIYRASASPKHGYDVQVTFSPVNRANYSEAARAIYEAAYGDEAPDPIPITYV